MRGPIIRWRLNLIATIVTLLLTASIARGEPERFAVVIGSNAGDASETTLLYAEDDARRISTILRELGGFLPENVLLLTDTDAEAVRRVLIRINARIRNTKGESLLFVFYSGHGDAESLHLGGTRYSMREIQNLLNGSPATARVLVLDACRSGALTRVKGGRAGPAFAIQLDDRLGAEGVAILTSSAAGEDSQESDQLKASFFTHYLASALLGAADLNADGQVTLVEGFQYASERTLAATSSTAAGPQHPTYRFTLGGRDDLVLTRTSRGGKRFGTLEFAKTGNYLVQEGGVSGKPVAEVSVTNKKRSVTLRAGKYFVIQRKPTHINQGQFSVHGGDTTLVASEQMQRIAYAQVVRKGGTSLQTATSLVAGMGARASILDLGISPRLQLGVRFDRPSLSIEFALAVARSRHSNRQVVSTNRENTASLTLLRSVDIPPLTLSLGIEAGALWLSQSFSNSPQTPARDTGGAFFAPTTQLQLPLGGPFYSRIDVSAVTYLIRADSTNKSAELRTPVAWRAGLFIGRFF